MTPTRHDEDGVSLVELLVTMAVMTLLGGLLVASVIGINRAVAVTESTTFDQAFGRNSMTLISRDVRAASSIPLSSSPAFQLATPFEVEFTALLGAGQVPDLVNIDVDASNNIVVTQTPPRAGTTAPSYVYDPADGRQRFAASFVVNELAATPDPIFRFFDVDGVELTDFSGAGGNLAAGQRARIAAVEIRVLLNRDPIITGATELRTSVRLPNAGARS